MSFPCPGHTAASWHSQAEYNRLISSQAGEGGDAKGGPCCSSPRSNLPQGWRSILLPAPPKLALPLSVGLQLP